MVVYPFRRGRGHDVVGGAKVMAVLVTLICGLAGLAYLVARHRQPTPFVPTRQERDRHDVERHRPQPADAVARDAAGGVGRR